ncbi:MAG: DUF4384 domain-containing protein [Bryobacteraceae bacterium]|jgi:hypothetical protein
MNLRTSLLPVLAAVFAMAPCSPAAGQSKTLEQGPRRMELTLERQQGGAWKAVDPGLVFAHDDRVRFRFHTNFDGYLYVMNQATSGNYQILFPREDTGQQNRIEAGKEYVVPAVQGWFRVSGPPGQDILYWMVTPLSLGAQPKYQPLPPPPQPGSVSPTLIPRCDDTVFKARGECVDGSAGAKEVRPEEKLPDNLSGVPGASSHDLMFIREKDTSVVASPVPLTAPVIYEFRLAHK